jgi:hypothetical protein
MQGARINMHVESGHFFDASWQLPDPMTMERPDFGLALDD